MCGIAAYSGKENATQIVINGLKSLEYRGYDSWGIASLYDDSIDILRKVGKIGQFTKSDHLNGSSIALGHTRWATHGEVTEVNAHPQFNKEKSIVVVHNGIVENYQELREFLISKGYVFISDTDTEVIPHMIDFHMKDSDFVEAFKKTVKMLEGSYSIVALSKDSQKIVASKNCSPLVLGISDDGLYIGSDIMAFLNYTKNVIYLDDFDFVVYDKELEIYNLESGKKTDKKIQEIDWDNEQAKKGNFDHFMIKEIFEQPETIQSAIQQDDQEVIEMAKEINNSYGTFFVACGSSYHAGLTAQYLFSDIASKHINVICGSEFRYHEKYLTDKTLMLPISQSGETADVLVALKAAKRHGTKVCSIVNVMGSSLMRESDHSFMINAGPEICVLSTKSYTSQLSLLTLLAYASIGKLEEGKKEIKKVAELITVFFEEKYLNKLKQLAEKIKEKNHVFVIGRGLNYPTAMEAALKIKEVSYIHAEGFPGGELKHGSIALIENETPCFAFVPEDETKHEILSNAMEIKSRGGFIIGIGPKDNKIFDFHIEVPDVKATSPIVNTIPIQIIAYYLAVKLGWDPDKPRNLAKSVTVK